MLTSITPLGERSRNSRWGLTVTTFVIGSTLAGALVGAVAGGLGVLLASFLPAASRLAILVGAALVGSALDLGLGGTHLPSVARQVNEDWMDTYRGWVYGVGFGSQLGLGFVTVVSASAVYLAFIAAALSGSVGVGALIGGVFGFARAAVIFATADVKTPAGLIALGDSLARWRRGVAMAGVAVQVALALVAFAVGVG